MKPTRRQLLLGSTAAALTGPLLASRAASDRPMKNLIVVVADGGWDLTFSFDPKPDLEGIEGPYVDLDPEDPQDVEEIRRWGEITVTCNDLRRRQVGQFFEEWSQRTAVVRGMWVGSVSHWIGRRRVLTGGDDLDAPDLATRVASLSGHERPLGVVDLSGHGRFANFSALSARGGARGQLTQLVDPTQRWPMGDGTPRNPLEVSVGEQAAMDRWLASRALRQRQDRAMDPGRIEALLQRDEARRRARALVEHSSALQLSEDGDDPLNSQVKFAASLLTNEICHTVLIDTGNNWDTHSSHHFQHGYHDQLFGSLSQLLHHLQGGGILDHTLVAVISEMARTPVRNADGGTEHWPYTGVLLAGAGVRGGRVCGGTDDRMIGVPVDLDTGLPATGGTLLEYSHVMAGILEHVGVDIAQEIPGIPPLHGWS
ncbi:MAG TPA: DUF1501 domain-containing protein [Deltaproteobacteria bacterium]|nr:DUF1501 domain-containing protein [Deltaproteobacteria bacterium]